MPYIFHLGKTIGKQNVLHCFKQPENTSVWSQFVYQKTLEK